MGIPQSSDDGHFHLEAERSAQLIRDLNLPYNPLPISLLADREGTQGWVILNRSLRYARLRRATQRPVSIPIP